MEEGEGEGLERVMVIDDDANMKKKVPVAPPLPGATTTTTVPDGQTETPKVSEVKLAKEESVLTSQQPQFL
jgi:hypothetical protein